MYEHYQFKTCLVDKYVTLEKLKHDYFTYVEKLKDHNVILNYDTSRLSIHNRIKIYELVMGDKLLRKGSMTGRLFLKEENIFDVPCLIEQLETIEYCEKILLLTD